MNEDDFTKLTKPIKTRDAPKSEQTELQPA